MRRGPRILCALLLAGAFVPLAGATPSGAVPAGLVLTASPVASPNGDGVKDRVTVEVDLAAPATVSVTVEKAGRTLATLADSVALDAGTRRLRWDGRNARGKVVPDGPYVVAAAAVGADGVETTAEADVRIDTRPPAVRWLGLEERPGAGALHARYHLADASPTVTLALEIQGSSGRPWARDRRSLAPGTYNEPLSLRAPDGGSLAPAAYHVWLLATDDAGNASRSPIRPILVQYPVDTHVIRRVDGAGSHIALTFDDCNDGAAWTSILHTLEARHVQASFFCLGPEVQRHAAQARRALRDGDTIGNHTWTHAYLPDRSYADIQSEIERSTDVWWRLARTAPLPYFRPPYGGLSSDALAAIGSQGYSRVVLWDVDPQDWREPGVAAIVEGATGPARSGSIVLLHVLPETAEALPEILTRLHGRGLRPVSIVRLLAS